MSLSSLRDRAGSANSDRAQLGVFMALILGAVALVTVSVVLLFGLQIAGGFGVDGDPFTVGNETFADDAAPFEYTVDRAPGSDDVVALDDDEAVYNVTGGTKLTEGSDYEWYLSNGTVEITDGSTDTGAEYNISYSGTEHPYAGSAASTETSTGDAFSLFGTSVLVIPAAAVLAVLVGGMVGVLSMRGQMPGMGDSDSGERRR